MPPGPSATPPHGTARRWHPLTHWGRDMTSGPAATVPHGASPHRHPLAPACPLGTHCPSTLRTQPHQVPAAPLGTHVAPWDTIPQAPMALPPPLCASWGGVWPSAPKASGKAPRGSGEENGEEKPSGGRKAWSDPAAPLQLETLGPRARERRRRTVHEGGGQKGLFACGTPGTGNGKRKFQQRGGEVTSLAVRHSGGSISHSELQAGQEWPGHVTLP